ncbi:hypothetical protein [Methylobacterium sp. A54F]
MTSISSTATSAAQLHGHRPPPGRERMNAAITSELSAGSISQTDATALTRALDAIDTSLGADQAGAGTGTSGSAAGSTARLDPSGIKDRIDGLIDDQVTSGALSSDQADTLKELFAEQGPGGPPPGGPPGASGTDPGDGTGDATSDLLATFMQQLQASQSGASGYGATGAGSAGTQASARLFDFQS